MDELTNNILVLVKKVKGIEGEESDDVFSFAVTTVVHDILIYCHLELEDWPEALNHTAALMTIDVINEVTLVSDDSTLEGEVKSLTEGDFSISKETKAEAFQKIMAAPSFARNYKRLLNRFRRTAR